MSPWERAGGGSPGCLRSQAIVPYLPPQRPCASARSYFWPGGRTVVCCCRLRQALGPAPLQNEVGRHPLAMGSREFWGRVCSFLGRATSGGVLVWAAIGKSLAQRWRETTASIGVAGVEGPADSWDTGPKSWREQRCRSQGCSRLIPALLFQGRAGR